MLRAGILNKTRKMVMNDICIVSFGIFVVRNSFCSKRAALNEGTVPGLLSVVLYTWRTYRSGGGLKRLRNGPFAASGVAGPDNDNSLVDLNE